MIYLFGLRAEKQPFLLRRTPTAEGIRYRFLFIVQGGSTLSA